MRRGRPAGGDPAGEGGSSPRALGSANNALRKRGWNRGGVPAGGGGAARASSPSGMGPASSPAPPADQEACEARRSGATSGCESGTTEISASSSSAQSAHRNGQGEGDRVGGGDLWLGVQGSVVEAAAGVAVALVASRGSRAIHPKFRLTE